MGITVEQAQTMAPDDMDEGAVRAEFLTVLETDGRALTAIATEVGIAYATLAAWRNDKYAGRNERVAAAVRAWLTRRVARTRAATVLPANPGFVMTRTASEIIDVLEAAQSLGRMAVVVGAPGTGKTMAFRQYRRTYPQVVWIATMQPCHTTSSAVLREIAVTLGLPQEHAAADISRSITRRLTDTQGLLIIDEAQHLPPQALDQVRSIHDVAEIGVVLGGNAGLMTKLGAIQRIPDLAQIFSRIALRYDRKRVLKADATALLDAWGIQNEAARTELLGIAMKPGGARVMVHVLTQAFVMASAAGDTDVALKHVQDAHGQLAGAA